VLCGGEGYVGSSWKPPSRDAPYRVSWPVRAKNSANACDIPLTAAKGRQHVTLGAGGDGRMDLWNTRRSKRGGADGGLCLPPPARWLANGVFGQTFALGTRSRNWSVPTAISHQDVLQACG
jgi:hypothetical protein